MIKYSTKIITEETINSFNCQNKIEPKTMYLLIINEAIKNTKSKKTRTAKNKLLFCFNILYYNTYTVELVIYKIFYFKNKKKSKRINYNFWGKIEGKDFTFKWKKIELSHG